MTRVRSLGIITLKAYISKTRPQNDMILFCIDQRMIKEFMYKISARFHGDIRI
jgi:hypothetical protein